ncbi:unnamed protein product [Adineta steineri]|uniref:Uncharacterized protein n=1 Tax=Adineta steineri TaxID=433720 RepID=A0A819KTV5_9BILA|nr:unnamed protein product [Adineta steineri]
MPLTAAQRAKNYRYRLKQKTGKYNDFKRKDRERKAKKRASMTVKEKEIVVKHHRIAQQRYREKLKQNNSNQPKSLYNKQTLAKAAKKVLRVLPTNPDKQHQILTRVGQNLGLFPKPTPHRQQASIPMDVIQKVQDFYKNDNISWQAPGKRDYVTVRENGTRVKYQKRFLLFNIREVHQLFIQDNPGLSIGPSSFAKLRPKFVLSKNCLAHRVCVCITHENVSLLLEALSKEVPGLANNLNTFLSKLVCDQHEKSCMMSLCNTCRNKFTLNILNKVIDKKKNIEWYQWSNTRGRATKKVFSGSVLKCAKLLQSKVPHYIRHVYIKRKQSDYFEYMKIHANDNTVICQIDYAENFSIGYQNQIQSAHWGKKLISIFTAYAWMGGSGGDGQSFAPLINQTKLISDDMIKRLTNKGTSKLSEEVHVTLKDLKNGSINNHVTC